MGVNSLSPPICFGSFCHPQKPFPSFNPYLKLQFYSCTGQVAFSLLIYGSYPLVLGLERALALALLQPVLFLLQVACLPLRGVPLLYFPHGLSLEPHQTGAVSTQGSKLGQHPPSCPPTLLTLSLPNLQQLTAPTLGRRSRRTTKLTRRCPALTHPSSQLMAHCTTRMLITISCPARQQPTFQANLCW
jgi:hypothetical protein